MTWYPIAFLPPQYQDLNGDNYSGAVLKAYEANTTTPIAMATDTGGLTTAASFALNASGYPVSGGAIIIPHVQEDYRLVLFPNQTAADANDTGSAIFNIPEIKIADAVNTPFLQSFSGDGTTTEFTLSSDLGTDEKTLMVFADRLREYSTNGSFDTDSDWTKGAGWTIGSGVATAAGAISTSIQQTAGILLVEGESYTVSMTITRSAGSITPNIAGTAGTARSSSGTYTETIIAGSTQTLEFSTSGFTGTLDDVSITRVNSTHREILRNDEFTLDGTSLTFNEAPIAGTSNILVFAPSLLLGAAGASAVAAAISETNAAASATLSEQWASLTTGIVDSTDYSSKAWAIGGTGVTDTAGRGAAKEWAINPEDDLVDGTDYSAKHYSIKSSDSATVAEGHKNAAAASAAAAASSAAEGLYRDVVTLTSADSPYTPSLAEEGTLFLLDMTSGAITINLSTLSTYGEDMKFAFAKMDGTANNGTVNRGGSDTIDGVTSLTLSIQYVVNVVVGDSATGSWLSAIQSQSLADNSVTNAKLADVPTATIKGRTTAGTGDPEDLTVAQVLALLNVYTQSQVNTLTDNYLHVIDQKAAGVDGGSASVGANTRTLNTVVTNNISGASLSSNQVTLPAGTYRFRGSAPVYTYQDNHNTQLYLYNATDTSVVRYGKNAYANGITGAGYELENHVSGEFTIAGTKAFELRHDFDVAEPTYGLGYQSNNFTNTFAELEIWKVS